MQITQKVELDLTQQTALPLLHGVQGDSGTRNVRMLLRSGGSDWQIPEGISVLIGYRKKDGTRGVYDSLPDGNRAWSAQGNLLTITLAPELCSVAGNVELEVMLMQEDKQLTTWTFTLKVAPLSHLKGGKSENYANLAVWMENWMAKYAGGRAVTSAEIDGDGNLIFTMSDDTEILVGKVKGNKGADGQPPIKGTDYWTEADKAELVAEVIAEFPVYTGEALEIYNGEVEEV